MSTNVNHLQPEAKPVETTAEEDEAWEKEQGIPQPTDAFIQKYFTGRDALIDQEDKHAFDRDFRDLLSPMAQEACAIVSQIRFEEQQTLWTTEFESDIAKSHPGADIYPGMMFNLAKDRIEKSKLWTIVRKMPKGALLHAHYDAMVDFDWFLRVTVEEPGMHIFAAKSLAAAEDRVKTPIGFRFVKESSRPDQSLWSEEYEHHAWVPIKSAAESFPDGGYEGFIAWLTTRTTITAEESMSHHLGPNDIWRKFISCFATVVGLCHYEPLQRKYTAKVLEMLSEDGVQWVDFRATFAWKHQLEGQEKPLGDLEGFKRFFQIMKEEVEKHKATEVGKNFWGARWIWTTMRGFDNRKIAQNMMECIEVKKEYPEILAGFDLVGQEDLGRPLADLVPLLFWFRKLCAEEGVTIPFFFHAGETLFTGDPTDHNLFDAILLGSRRLGHGFSLYKHPLLMNMCRDRSILVESCPISNETLRLTGSILTHPLPSMLAHGVPTALCNDDPGMLGQSTAGMSHDFFQAVQGIESLGLAGLGALAENSIRWAAFEDIASQPEWVKDVKAGAYGQGIRAQRLKEWKREWEKFCQWIVVEYGADLELDPED